MATFGQYFHRICKDDSRKARLESDPGRHEVPLLSKDKVNRVLIYGGAFNPPHVGHLGTLCHAFQNSPDLNIVGGIIYPMDADYIKDKNRCSGRWLVLSEEERSELWERDARFPSWAFAPKNKFDTSQEFGAEIAKAAKEDGYDILYISLGGPDNWDFDLPRRHLSTSCTEFLISNATRCASFVSSERMNGVPDSVRGYTTWQKLEIDLQHGAERAQHLKRLLPNLELPPLVAGAAEAVKMVDRESSHSPPSNISQIQITQSSSSNVSSNAVAGQSTPGSSVDDVAESCEISEAETYDQENTIWECFEQCAECHENCDLGLRLRLICKIARDVGPEEDVEDEISSTSLYRIITERSGEDRRERLQNHVLSPELFCKYLQQTGFDYVSLAGPFFSTNEEEEQNSFYEMAWRNHLAGEHSSEAHAHIDDLGNSKLAAVQENESACSVGPASWSLSMVCVSSLLLVALTNHLLPA